MRLSAAGKCAGVRGSLLWPWRPYGASRLWRAGAMLLLLALWTPTASPAADVSDAQELYQTGQYRACAELCREAIEQGEYSESWRIYKIRADLASGRFSDAQETLEAALRRFRTSILLRWLGREVHLWNGHADQAEAMLNEIGVLTEGASWRYSDPLSRVTLGRFALERGTDPKLVLDEVYDGVKQRTRSFSEPFVAAAELALDKHDYAMAAEELLAALRLDPGNPDIHFMLARAFAPSEEAAAQQHLEAALERNPRHVPSLLFLVDRHVDAERYDEARQLLDRVLRVNVREPRAWAYLAVLAHLDNDTVGEDVCREIGLAWWQTNVEVDSLIGRKLSQKYRFEEGAAFQRRALAVDPDYLPAKMALSQDLLRLGVEEEGWRLADEVYSKDGYNVVAHNLVTLRDHLSGFRTLAGNGFLVRMDAREAEIYGDRVLELLERAREHLGTKYQVTLKKPILVEIFPDQQDFAIRTFGLPGGAGYLGVCFGNVITANSPASQAARSSNWEAVLWHEFCHVATLNKTNNKMPRWLSEGISVYEETQANPAWGQSMTPQYRDMVLGEDLVPVSQLSGAFLNPPTPQHLQFAYFESAMVVEYLVEHYGQETLERILVDLGVGMPINDALQRYTGSLAALDEEFAAYARERAERLAPGMNWDRPEFRNAPSMGQLATWNREHPNNFWGLQLWASALVEARQWSSAKQPLERLLELFPQYAGDDSAYVMLSRVHRELSETDEERAVLEELARRRADATEAYLRLMELAAASADWEDVLESAERTLAVDPLQRAPYRYLSDAAEALGDHQRAADALSVLEVLGPHDAADVHYRLATHLRALGRLPEARRHILESLEDAPRFRAAHRVLLDILKELETDPQGAQQAERLDTTRTDEPEETE